MGVAGRKGERANHSKTHPQRSTHRTKVPRVSALSIRRHLYLPIITVLSRTGIAFDPDVIGGHPHPHSFLAAGSLVLDTNRDDIAGQGEDAFGEQ